MSPKPPKPKAPTAHRRRASDLSHRNQLLWTSFVAVAVLAAAALKASSPRPQLLDQPAPNASASLLHPDRDLAASVR